MYTAGKTKETDIAAETMVYDKGQFWTSPLGFGKRKKYSSQEKPYHVKTKSEWTA